MKFIFMGEKDNPVIVLIHGMFCNSDSNKHFIKYLKDNYCIIMPILDVHCCDETIYTTKEELAHMSKRRLMKKYPNSIFRDMEGFKHLGYQTRQPMEYAKILKDTIG